MSTLTLTRPFGTGLSALALRLLRTAGRRRSERLAIRQLQAMTDRELADIGLHRGQIHAAVRGLLTR